MMSKPLIPPKTKSSVQKLPKSGLWTRYTGIPPRAREATTQRLATLIEDLMAAGLPVEPVIVSPVAPSVNRWAGRLPAPGDPPYGISKTAWARHHRKGDSDA
jgi:hypothetical protein